ncbi:MAG: PTS fructose transporter subunit IIB [Clostridium sp.]
MPTGIAHTYMAQECLEKECRKRGFDVKIETQGGLGIENELSEEDVAQADVVILAVSVVIEGRNDLRISVYYILMWMKQFRMWKSW